MSQVTGDSSVVGLPAVLGTSVVSRGVEGHSTKDHGVVGVSEEGTGVFGRGQKGRGVEGHSTKDHGVLGVSVEGRGVEGESTENHAIVGTSKGIGTGVFGLGTKGRGVEGQSTENHAIVGTSKGKGAGVLGITDDGNGIEGRSTNHIGVFGKGGKLAGRFEGNVEVTGELSVQGHSIIQLLQRIENLEKRLERQQPRVTGVVGRRITVTGVAGSNQGLLGVTGVGFGRNVGVTIRVVTRFRFIGDFQFKTNELGRFDGQIKIGRLAETVFIAATDNLRDEFDLTGFLWSDTVSLPEVF